jgi:outer membrane protein assembly factor BamB
LKRVLVWLLAALAASGCSGGSPGPAPAILPRIAEPQAVRVVWQAGIGTAEQFTLMPVLAGDSVYSAARDGRVVRFDAANGRERWRSYVDMRISGGVGADTSTVVVASEAGEVVALDADTGKQRWRARVSSEVLSPPAVGRGVVLVRSIDSRIFAFNADDGKRRWVYQRPSSPLVVRTPAGAVIRDDTAFAGFRGGKLAALALSNGGLRWESTVALPKGTTELERVIDVVGDPVLSGREVCATAYQGRLACFDAVSGSQIWAREVSSVTGVSLDARYAFVADDKGNVQAFDRSTGGVVWKQDKLTYRQLTLPLPVGNAVVVGDIEGYVHFLSRENGAFLGRFNARGGGVRVPPLLLPSGAMVQTQTGTRYALSL